jgi:PHD/YefM family antitoxin component YafN of YafNO toxin-antitoxin module
MFLSLPTGGMLDALVPISRFNKGGANKIFAEVAKAGYKIVIKNNIPACVLISPDKYREMLEAMEDQRLAALARERLQASADAGRSPASFGGVEVNAPIKDEAGYSHEEIMREYGITQKDIDETEVDLG